MAIANYQIPTKIKFFPSYLQYAYAAGLIKGVDYQTQNETTKEDLYRLLVLDPSHTSQFDFLDGDFIAFDLNNPTLNFDFGMILGHDQKANDITFQPYTFDFEDGNATISSDPIGTTGIVNYFGGDATLNGWSAFNIPSCVDSAGYGFVSSNYQGTSDGKLNIGSLSYGKSWTAPQNVDLNVNVNYNFGYKQKKTIGGKTISQMNYYKQSKWLLDAWELSDVNSDTRTEPTESRNGLRTWSVGWSFLQDKYAMSQNNMNNSNNWTIDSDSEYSTGADGTSLYNSSDGIDFYTSVIKTTMGGHLPVVIRISESNNSDQWAIVRIKKYSISQKSPKFIDVKLTLEEQV